MTSWVQLCVQNIRKLLVDRRWLFYHGWFKIITETDDQSSNILPSAPMLWPDSPAQVDEGENGKNSIYWRVCCLKGTLGQETVTSLLESLWGADQKKWDKSHNFPLRKQEFPVKKCPASLSFTISWSLLKLMSTESVMPSNHLILCCPLLLLPSIFASIRVFSNESALCIRWPKYWSFSVSPSNEYSGLISFSTSKMGVGQILNWERSFKINTAYSLIKKNHRKNIL